MMDSVFQLSVHKYMRPPYLIPGFKLLEIDEWDLQTRKNLIKQFLNE